VHSDDKICAMMKRLMLFFFHQLYHRFAWGYDFVAWLVSLGRWNDWCRAIIPLLPGGRLLELGSGPGHLQKHLANSARDVYGLDESWQMTHLAAKNYPGLRLMRARAQNTPFASASFAVIVATFPAPYIFELQTAAEVSRILNPDGQFIALLAARPAGGSLPDRFIRALFKITGETPPTGFDYSYFSTAYHQQDFWVNTAWERHPTADLLILRCAKRV
jgi:ubiquinone/menaquinone biosynthesis C-methylase UbiE